MSLTPEQIARPARAFQRPMRLQVADRLRLLDVLPTLAADLDARNRTDAAAFLQCPAVHVLKGPWDPGREGGVTGVRGRVLGFVVVEGLLLRETVIHSAPSAQALGPGSIVFSADTSDGGGPLQAERRLRALVRSRVALLDDTLLMAGLRWPRIMGRLLAAAGAERDRLSRYHAIGQLPRAEDRLLAMLWELAAQFGHVAGDGVHVGASLTHEVLGTLIGARRPTVSLALVGLIERGVLRGEPGAWILDPDSAELIGAAPPARV
jgi:CRP/FNR family transcriptional regulator, cyclic AMP receptor protein